MRIWEGGDRPRKMNRAQGASARHEEGARGTAAVPRCGMARRACAKGRRQKPDRYAAPAGAGGKAEGPRQRSSNFQRGADAPGKRATPRRRAESAAAQACGKKRQAQGPPRPGPDRRRHERKCGRRTPWHEESLTCRGWPSRTPAQGARRAPGRPPSATGRDVSLPCPWRRTQPSSSRVRLRTGSPARAAARRAAKEGRQGLPRRPGDHGSLSMRSARARMVLA